MEECRLEDLYCRLTTNCAKCCGLCCVALYFSKSEGFPSDKEPGKPCPYLQEDFRCRIHPRLKQKGIKGCMAYDCFGAGQYVTQNIYGGANWKQASEIAGEMQQVFLVVAQLHHILWYLAQGLSLQAAEHLERELAALLQEVEDLTALPPGEIVRVVVRPYKERATPLLLQAAKLARERFSPEVSIKKQADYIGKNLRGKVLAGADFSMTLLMAANLEGCRLPGANFLGADLRDANLKGADLSGSLFLTQGQLNTALGDKDTLLPPRLAAPVAWKS